VGAESLHPTGDVDGFAFGPNFETNHNKITTLSKQQSLHRLHVALLLLPAAA
jgi:hypothetical protein